MNTPNNRLETLKTVREIFPDLSATEAMRLASWADTGIVDIDPDRVEAAARVLLQELGHDQASRELHAYVRGIVQAVVVGYMTHVPEERG